MLPSIVWGTNSISGHSTPPLIIYCLLLRKGLCLPIFDDFAAKSVDREIRNFAKTSAVEVLLLRSCLTGTQPALALSFQLGSAVILSDINTTVGCCLHSRDLCPFPLSSLSADTLILHLRAVSKFRDTG